MDNLGSHKAAALRRMIRAVGARLWYLVSAGSRDDARLLSKAAEF
jgi:hypothetical protein